MRGQVETMGLLVIVVLIVFIAIFSLKFMTFADDKMLDSSFYNVKANNLLNAIQKASVCGENMEKAIIACFDQDTFCGVEACAFVEETVGEIIEKTVEEDASFIVVDQNGRVGIQILGCSNGINSVSSFIRDRGTAYEMSVKLCPK